MTSPESQENSNHAIRFTLSIPSRDLDTLEKILQLDDGVRDSLWAAIDAAPINASWSDLQSRIVVGTSLTRELASDITAMLSSMYYSKERTNEIRPDEFVEGVVRAVATAKSIDINSDLLRKAVSKLLSFERLSLKTKAQQVMLEHEHVMDDARILTDIRPVFSGSDTSIAATLVIHNLRIRHTDNAGHTKDFIVAMDSNDLRDLWEAIERATKKEAEIRAFMARSGMFCIGTTVDE